ncbi:MAG TPA: hypothetical protein VH062_02610 [Polyangiaceae bacterium]|jgi:hypothetical protein|nr:hypothetical protein [Polyangiaceae bacterium]
MVKPFKEREMTLLREVLVQHVPLRKELLAGVEANAFTPEQRSELCQIISSEFVRTGLGSDDEPNARGLELEALLDTVNRPRLKPDDI